MESKLEKIKRILKKKPNKPYTDGTHIYLLVDDKVVEKPINHFNSYFNEMQWLFKLINLKDLNLSPIETFDLEEWEILWSLLDSEYKLFSDGTTLEGRDKIYDDVKVPPLSEFLTDVQNVRYPRPEVMLSINDCFQFYFDSAGRVSLEEVFFGKPKKSAGNAAARNKSQDKFVQFAIAIYFNDEEQTKTEIANKLIRELDLSDSPESLIRQFNRKIQNKPSFLNSINESIEDN